MRDKWMSYHRHGQCLGAPWGPAEADLAAPGQADLVSRGKAGGVRPPKLHTKPTPPPPTPAPRPDLLLLVVFVPWSFGGRSGCAALHHFGKPQRESAARDRLTNRSCRGHSATVQTPRHTTSNKWTHWLWAKTRCWQKGNFQHPPTPWAPKVPKSKLCPSKGPWFLKIASF